MATRDDTPHFCRGLALILGLAGTALAAMCVGAAAGLVVGFGYVFSFGAVSLVGIALVAISVYCIRNNTALIERGRTSNEALGLTVAVLSFFVGSTLFIVGVSSVIGYQLLYG